TYLLILFFLYFKIPPPPRSTLFPYTTLFRSSAVRYSDISKRKIADSFPKKVAASAFVVSVFPTPVGPRKRNEPIGRFSLPIPDRSEEHTSELQSRGHLVCRLLLEKKNKILNT